MKAHTDVQVLKGADGVPAHVLMSYQSYLEITGQKEPTIPNEVVGLVIKEGLTPIRAWREHLGMTQAKIARRLKITQSAYAQQEQSENPRRATLIKIAKALNIHVDQLDVYS
jgi:DNA-binding XRE family transcriptional regulator